MIYDNWHKSRPRADEPLCEHGLVPSKRHGIGLQWRVRWRGSDGTQRARDFAARPETEAFAAAPVFLPKPPVPLHEGIDPRGCYVYMLWENRGDDVPVYVGSSTNILARLGSHLGGSNIGTRGVTVGWVSLIKCRSKSSMLAREDALIRKHQPRLNRRGIRASA